MKIFKVLIVYLILPMSFGFAQNLNKDYYYQISSTEGLTNDKVNDIVQDSLGYIWIATDDGLSRYNGRDFENFEHDLSGGQFLSDNYIQKLHINEWGDLWILTDKGLDFYDVDQESFKSYTTENSSLSHNSLTAITEVSPDSLLVGTYGGGIDLKTSEGFFNLFQFESGPSSLSSNLVSELLYTEGLLWVGYFYNGVDVIDLQHRKVKRYAQIKPSIFNDLEIRDMMRLNKELMLFATNKGLVILDSSNDEVSHLGKESMDQDLLSLKKVHDGNTLLVGSRNSGFYNAKVSDIINRKEIIWSQVIPGKEEGELSHKSVSVFFEDDRANLWIGTHREGVNVVASKRPSIELKWPSYNFWGIGTTQSEDFILGTDGQGLFLDEQSGSNLNKLIKDSNLAVLCALEGNDQLIFVGTYQDGLWLVPKQGNPEVFNTENSVLRSNDIRSLFLWKDKVFVGVNGGGLYVYENNQLRHIENSGSLDIRVIEQKSKKELWLGTYGNGLIQFDVEEERLVYMDEFPVHIIFDLKKVNEDLWVGSRNQGLWKINSDNEFTQFSKKDDLYSNTIQAIETYQDVLFMSTNKGINFLDLKTQKIDGVNRFRTAVLNGFNNGSSFVSQKGEIYFGTRTGLVKINADITDQKAQFVPIVVEKIKLGPEVVQVDKNSKVLTENINLGGTLHLDYDQNDITLQVAGLIYPVHGVMPIEYQLAPYDESWIVVPSNGEIGYRNLNPGSYNLKLRMSPSQQVYTSSFYDFPIEIDAPLYATFWAYSLYALLLIAVFVIALNYYTDRVNLKSNLQYEKKLRQQEHDLNLERAQFFTSFSHELRTPLTLIKGPLEDLLDFGFGGSVTKKLELIRKNSDNLSQMIDNLLEYRKSEQAIKSLDLSEVNLESLLKSYHDLFKARAAKNGIDFELKLDQEIQGVYLDQAKLKIILTNLLSNAFKFTPERGQIILELKVSKSKVKILVRDSGQGVLEEEQEKIFELYYRSARGVQSKSGTGIGLALCKRLAEMHCGRIKLKSIPNKKTSFSFEFPLNLEDYPVGSYNLVQVDREEFPKSIRELGIKVDRSLIENTEDVSIDYDQRAPVDLKDEVRLLIIDDNKDILEYLRDIFESKYRIITAENGEEGVELASKHIPNLIISDVMMPKKSGMDLVQELKANIATCHIPILLLTAKLNEEDRVKGIAMGAEDYVFKPFNPKYLKAKVQTVLNNQLRSTQELDANRSGLSEMDKDFLCKLDEGILKICENSGYKNSLLAEQMHMSESSLYRKVKALTEESLTGYAVNIRLERSVELMISSHYTIASAAFEVGYKDMKHFRKLFKEHFGETPSTYIKLTKKTNQ